MVKPIRRPPLNDTPVKVCVFANYLLQNSADQNTYLCTVMIDVWAVIKRNVCFGVLVIEARVPI